jgi:hypothetical protein
MIHSKSLMTHGTLQLSEKLQSQWNFYGNFVINLVHSDVSDLKKWLCNLPTNFECDYILGLNHIGPSWSPAALNTRYVHLHSKQHSPKIARSKIGGFDRLILSFIFKFCLCSWLGDHWGWNFETLISFCCLSEDYFIDYYYSSNSIIP